jgi:hypothetical protein
MNQPLNELFAAVYKTYFGTEPHSVPSDAVSRAEILQMLEKIAVTLHQQRRVRMIDVVCNDATNPPSSVDRGYTNVMVCWRDYIEQDRVQVFAAGDPQWVQRTTKNPTMIGALA